MHSFLSLLSVAVGASALYVPSTPNEANGLVSRDYRDNSGLTPGCENSPTSRQCWGEYDINTDYYNTIFHTGVTREYWLSIDEIDCAPDGYLRKCMAANGTMPGPAITADWGDEVIVHVTNNLPSNGTAIHWHGIRQLNNNQYDGVPGITQCPIVPGSSMTYKFHATQYGTAMYHSHFSLQAGMGVFGPLVINGPATADYDIDVGTIFFTDWDRSTAFEHWATVATFNVTFNGLGTGLVNGMNIGNCTLTNTTNPDPNCIGEGKKYELVLEPGKKHRLRLINMAIESWFQFSIDGHKATVIGADLVPVVPYETDSVLVNMGQRYDVIIEANQEPKDYWLRGGFETNCIPNGNADHINGIVRYSNESKAEPSSVSTVVQQWNCLDEPAEATVPWLPVDVTNLDGGVNYQNVTGEYWTGKFLRWSFNKADGGFMWTNWSQPALGSVVAGDISSIPVQDNIFQVGNNVSSFDATKNETGKTEWVVLVIDEKTPIVGIAHPMHLHGHDMMLLASASNVSWDGTTDNWQWKNPTRRDTVSLPPNGYMAIAWALDNPGLWFLHCHIAWHSSQGFGVTMLESAHLLAEGEATSDWKPKAEPQCAAWNEWYPTSPWPQEDAGV
ncbi:hypothetical protein N0V83_003732 [Neocucurbitaria cava]|uniref:Laccase n=1 Tax=Neocucurbitaria cava TaxID=798079 RepID=A0A9W8YAH8_9PLEO|nr:hypothetical protein N0V83_003732 [Neocucurbitaria cava]